MYVYSSDTDVFFILLKHCHIFNCAFLFQHLVSGLVDIKAIHNQIGDTCASALLALHAITGCDTTGRFEGKTRQLSFRRFMKIDRTNCDLVNALATLQNSLTLDTIVIIESFICRAYLYSTKKATSHLQEEHNLSDTRFYLFTKRQLEGEKLPPTMGSLKKHLESILSVMNLDFSKCGNYTRE